MRMQKFEAAPAGHRRSISGVVVAKMLCLEAVPATSHDTCHGQSTWETLGQAAMEPARLPGNCKPGYASCGRGEMRLSESLESM